MRFFSLVKKELIHNFRDKKAMFLMTIFPILLILILGMALSGTFSSSIMPSKIKVAYIGDRDKEIYKSFKEFTKEKTLNIEFEEIKDEETTKEMVSDGRYDGLIKFTDDDTIELFKNNIRELSGNLIKTVIQTFTDKSNVVNAVIKVNPSSVEDIINKPMPDNVKINEVKGSTKPTSRDYYAVTMFTMIILYSTNIGAFGVLGENLRKTYERIMASTVTPIEYLCSKVLGAFLITSFQVSIVYLFSRYVLNTNWGDRPYFILLISASLIFMAVSLGIGLSIGIKNPIVMSAGLNMTIPLFVFLAGGYIPLTIFNNKILNMVSNISPLKWTNDAIFRLIYNNDLSIVPIAIAVNLIIGLIFLSMPLIAFNRRDVV